MKKQKFSSQELGLIAMAYYKGLFPKPTTGEILFEKDVLTGGCIFNFNPAYYEKYLTTMQNAASSGTFARSNSEQSWLDLIQRIELAETVEIPEGELEMYSI